MKDFSLTLNHRLVFNVPVQFWIGAASLGPASGVEVLIEVDRHIAHLIALVIHDVAQEGAIGTLFLEMLSVPQPSFLPIMIKEN